MRIYPEFLRAWWHAEIDPSTATFAAQFVDDTAVFADTDLVLDDLTAFLLGDPVELPTVTAAATVDGLDVSTDDDPVLEVTGLTLGDDVGALVIFIDTGSAATSTLVAFVDQRSDTTPVAFESDGDPVDLDWPAGPFMRL